MEPPVKRFAARRNRETCWLDIPNTARDQILGYLDDVTKMSAYICSVPTIRMMPQNCIKKLSHVQEGVFSVQMLDGRYIQWRCIDRGSCSKAFQLLIDKNKESLRAIAVIQFILGIENTTITHLKNLETVSIYHYRHGMFENYDFTNFEQLYQVVDVVQVAYITLSLENLLKFKGRRLTFHYPIIPPKAFNEYIKLFVTGEVKETTTKLSFLRCEIPFDEKQILEGVNVIGKNERVFGRPSFLVVSSTNRPRIAVITLPDSPQFSMEIYTKEEFDKDEKQFSKFGKEAVEKLRKAFNKD